MSLSTDNKPNVPSDLYYDEDTYAVRIRHTEEAVARVEPSNYSEVTGDWTYDESATGRLFAASPKLFALAVEYEKNIEWTGAPDEFCQRLRAVIAEVRGGGQ